MRSVQHGRVELSLMRSSCLVLQRFYGLGFESILLVMNVRTAWTAASEPPLTETPSWIGINSCNTARETA